MKKYFLLLLVSFISVLSYGHMISGEITYKCLGGLTYEVEIITYTEALSPVDRPELTLLWGDGSQNIVARYELVYIPNSAVKCNRYKGTHTFATAGTYTLSFEDYRDLGIINLPNSYFNFYVSSTLIINQQLDCNNSPVFNNPPMIDSACVGNVFNYNIGAYDTDGDSLSYKLIACKSNGGIDITGYIYPQATNSFAIDSITGNLIWNAPIMSGEYNIAIQVEEWRNGLQIGNITRDMLIYVNSCNSTDIKNNQLKYDVQVLPNPTNDNVYIKSSLTKNIKIEICDITGKLILFKNCQTNEMVNISGITKGIYILRIIDNKNILTERIIID